MNGQRPAQVLEGAFAKPAQIVHHRIIIGQPFCEFGSTLRSHHNGPRMAAEAGVQRRSGRVQLGGPVSPRADWLASVALVALGHTDQLGLRRRGSRRRHGNAARRLAGWLIGHRRATIDLSQRIPRTQILL